MRLQIGRLLLLVFLFADAGAAWALNGNEWLDKPEKVREHYVMGIIDTWMGLYVSWEGEKERHPVTLNETGRSYHDVASCILAKEMSYSDAMEIIELHVRMSLQKRDASMSYLALEAIHQQCPDSQ